MSDFTVGAWHGSFPITRRIYQGRFLDEKGLKRLHGLGVTHILNLCETKLERERGEFLETKHIAVPDLVTLPLDKVIEALDSLYCWLVKDEHKVYVHCAAGQNRSPTIVWLFFVACGLDRERARQLLEESNYDAVAPHPRLIDDALVEAVLDHGSKSYRKPVPARLFEAPS